MFRWAIKGTLAGKPRPRRRIKPLSQVSKSVVDAWIRQMESLSGPGKACADPLQRRHRPYGEGRVFHQSKFKKLIPAKCIHSQLLGVFCPGSDHAPCKLGADILSSVCKLARLHWTVALI